jgi:hypothetical protein
MLYETQSYATCSVPLHSNRKDAYTSLPSKIPGMLLWNGFKKRNEIAFVCSNCKTKRLYHLLTTKNSQS